MRRIVQTESTTEQAPVKTTLYELTGGEETVKRIVNRFYDLMDTDPRFTVLRAMHAPDLGPMRETLTQFLCGWLGGPRTYFERPGHNCVVSAHKAFAIGELERDEWVACMRQAMVECDVPDELRDFLDKAFFKVSEAFHNR